MEAGGLGSTRCRYQGTTVLLASMVFSSIFAGSFFLFRSHFVYQTEGRISWFWWIQPLMPHPAGLPRPAVRLLPHDEQGGDRHGGQKQVPWGSSVPEVHAQQLLGSIFSGKLTHFLTQEEVLQYCGVCYYDCSLISLQPVFTDFIPPPRPFKFCILVSEPLFPVDSSFVYLY